MTLPKNTVERAQGWMATLPAMSTRVLRPLARAPEPATSPASPSSSEASSPKVSASAGAEKREDEREKPAEREKKPGGGRGRPRKAGEATPKPKKARKRTYYMRKEELATLTEELEDLRRRNAKLLERAAVDEQRAEVQRVERQNAAINDAVRGQRLLFANAHSMFTQFMRVQEQSPFESFIKLGSDQLARHATLQAMKHQKLRNAREFLEARMRHMDESADFSEHQKFTNQHGDLCYNSFDVTPLPLGQTSVKTVFDVVLNFAYTFEMSISEVLGDITIRENDDTWDPSVSQHRLVTLVGNRVEMETNHVMFGEYYPNGPSAAGETDCPPLSPRLGSSSQLPEGQEIGILASDFVNEDELYPYRPDKFLRQDVTVLTMVRRSRKSAVPGSGTVGDTLDASSASGDDGITTHAKGDSVLLIRWALIRVRRSGAPLTLDVRRRLHEGIQKVDAAMINYVRASIGPRRSAFSILHPPPSHVSFNDGDGVDNSGGGGVFS